MRKLICAPSFIPRSPSALLVLYLYLRVKIENVPPTTQNICKNLFYLHGLTCSKTGSVQWWEAGESDRKCSRNLRTHSITELRVASWPPKPENHSTPCSCRNQVSWRLAYCRVLRWA